MYRYNCKSCYRRLKPFIPFNWIQTTNHVRFSTRSEHSYIKNSKSRESRLIDLISSFEETVLKHIDPQSDPVDPVDKYLAQPSWSTHTLGHDPDSSDSPISDEEVLHLLRISALPPPKTSDQLVELRQDLQSQLSFVREIQRVNTKGVKPLVCVRNETKEGLRDLTIGLNDLQHALSKEDFMGKCSRPKRLVEAVPCKENDWDVFATSENITSLNGEKYFFVENQVSTSSTSKSKHVNEEFKE